MFSISRKQTILIIVFAAAFFLFFFRLGYFPFLDYDEATYALVSYESFQSGDFLSFTSRGEPWVDKPPLYFWLAAASSKIFGFNEFALRFPSAFLGMLSVLLVWLITLRLSDNHWTALVAAAILLLNGEFIFAARQMRLDVPVTAAILFSLYSFIRGWENPRWYLGFGVGLALGVLLKSTIGLLAIPIIFIFSIIYWRWDWLKNWYWWFGLVLSAILFIPWHIYEAAQVPGFLKKYLTHITISRFTRSTGGFWYYPKFLLEFVQPWISVFAIAGLWYWLKGLLLFQKNKLAVASSISTILIFIFFSLVSTKLFYYLEPMHPFTAIFIAVATADFFSILRTETVKRKWIIVLSILFLIGLGNTLWQVFRISGGRGEEYALAKEEKALGLYLNSQQISNKVYTSNFYNYETIYYYSHGKNNKGAILQIIPFREISTESFFLVIPNEVFKMYELDASLKARARPVYIGEILTMFEVQ